jgi:pyruvate kinase
MTMNNTNNLELDDDINENLGNKEQLGNRISDLYYNIIKNAERNKNRFPLSIMPENEASRDNLLSYLALRQYNLQDLQMKLAEEGLSSLGRLEGQVLFSIEQVLKHFKQPSFIPSQSTSCLLSRNNNKITSGLKKITHQESRILTTKRSRLLLGRPRRGRSSRIMVTLDSESTHQPHLLEELLRHGMDIARINCAHDTPKDWKMLIDSIRHAEKRLIQRGQDVGRRCRIVMDLAGPKIRTGPMGRKVRPLKIAVPKDVYGRPLKLAEGFLDSEAKYTEKSYLTGVPPSFVISIKQGSTHLANLKIGERLWFMDSRDRYRSVTILERISPTRVKIGLDKTTYLQEGIVMHRQKFKEDPSNPPMTIRKDNIDESHNNDPDLNSTYRDSYYKEDDDGHNDGDHGKDNPIVVGTLRLQPIVVKVKSGDIVLLQRNKASIETNSSSSYSHVYEKPIAGLISCNMPEVLKNVQVGHHVYIDDGKISAVVRSSTEEYLELEILSPSDTTAKIKTAKGLNFPDSNLQLTSLTSEDVSNLSSIVNNATAVGQSFVHSANDIINLHKSLSKMGRLDFGIIAKIETREAVHNLAKILLAGLDFPNFGILIARGDLAVEVGFENLPIIQEDILCMCEAAHIPVILATQVLETMAKSGLPTRAEMTDAAVGQRADCVMLNKGRHILEAVKILSTILTSENKHYAKKRQLFREFIKQSEFIS